MTIREPYAGVHGGPSADGPIDVWHVDLDACPLGDEALAAILSADERERAGRFHRPRDARRYAVGRAGLRLLLADRLGVAPARIRFEYGPHGKPAVVDASLPFNVSHSRGAALIAVGGAAALGVDIEAHDDAVEIEAIASRFFTAREVAQIRAAGPAAPTRFFRAWTRKEAYLKAVGGGLSIPLTSVEIELVDVPRILRIDADERAHESWSVRDLEAPDGYAAALVVRSGRPPALRRGTFDWGAAAPTGER